MTPVTLPPECPSMPLLMQITRLRVVRSHALLGDLGIHPSQYHLLVIAAHTGGLRQSDLANRLYIKQSTLTVMVERLVKAGFLTKIKDPRDGRVTRIHITQEGADILTEATARFEQIERETFNGFTPEDHEQFSLLASRIRDNLARITQGDEHPCS